MLYLFSAWLEVIHFIDLFKEPAFDVSVFFFSLYDFLLSVPLISTLYYFLLSPYFGLSFLGWMLRSLI